MSVNKPPGRGLKHRPIRLETARPASPPRNRSTGRAGCWRHQQTQRAPNHDPESTRRRFTGIGLSYSAKGAGPGLRLAMNPESSPRVCRAQAWRGRPAHARNDVPKDAHDALGPGGHHRVRQRVVAAEKRSASARVQGLVRRVGARSRHGKRMCGCWSQPHDRLGRQGNPYPARML